MVYADKEFFATDTVAACEEHAVTYVIPAPRNKRVKRFVGELDEEVTVESHTLYRPMKNSVSTQRVVTTVVGLPPDESYEVNGVFSTNSEVDEEIGLDRRETRRTIGRYDNRGGIKNTYKKIKEIGSWTTTKSIEVRFFHFGFATLLYNMWLFIDFLVQVSLDLEVTGEPAVSLERFKGVFYRQLVRLI
jgi:IS4 transposase